MERLIFVLLIGFTCILNIGATTPESTEDPIMTKTLPDGNVIRCHEVGYLPYPTDSHKYIQCEYITIGTNKAWSVNIRVCPPGTLWYQPTQCCIEYTKSNVTLTTEALTEVPKVTKVIDAHVIRCFKEGMIPHPTDKHKYVFCVCVEVGDNKIWEVKIFDCAPGMIWDEPRHTCTEHIEPGVNPTTMTTTLTTTPTTSTSKPTIATTTKEPKVSQVIDGYVIGCYELGPIPHPTDKHKYVGCEYVEIGPNKGWSIHIMECPPKTIWNQTLNNCTEEN